MLAHPAYRREPLYCSLALPPSPLCERERGNWAMEYLSVVRRGVQVLLQGLWCRERTAGQRAQGAPSSPLRGHGQGGAVARSRSQDWRG